MEKGKKKSLLQFQLLPGAIVCSNLQYYTPAGLQVYKFVKIFEVSVSLSLV